MKFTRLAFVLLLTASLTTPLTAAPFRDGIVVFGDSLSDTGFFDSITAALDVSVPGPGYTDGRFSNGPVWIEHVADALGHAPPRPPTRGGTNYAFGAAVTDASLAPPEEADLVHMDRQVAAHLEHLSQRPGRPPRHDLFVLWGGANDLMRGDPDSINPQVSAQNIGRHIEQLYAAGGRNFLVGDLPLLGNVPAFANPQTPEEQAIQAKLNQLSRTFNDALEQVLSDLEQQPGLNLFRLPAADLFDAVWAGEHDDRFTNVDEPAVPGLEPGATEWGDPVPNPEQYMFWDDIHPSAEMHQLIGETALHTLEGLGPPGWYRQPIPEPGSAAILAGATLVLLTRRRR